MKYTDFVLLATQASIVRDNGKKRLPFNLLASGIFGDPMPRELDVTAVRNLMKKAGDADADWNDARRLGEALASALYPENIGNTLTNKITSQSKKRKDREEGNR